MPFAGSASFRFNAAGEAARAWSHKQRIAVFLAAMRHYAAALGEEGWTIDYQGLEAEHPSLGDGLADALARHRPARVRAVEAGEWRVQAMIESTCRAAGVELCWHEDSHFYCSRGDFAGWARGRKQLVMEFFYRELRKRFNILMEDGQPAGGAWNFDRANRGSFGRKGPGALPPWRRFEPDDITHRVLADRVEMGTYMIAPALAGGEGVVPEVARWLGTVNIVLALFNLVPGMGAYSFLIRRTSPDLAERIILSGELLTAQKMLSLGLVDEVVPDTALELAARKLALRLAEQRKQGRAKELGQELHRLLCPGHGPVHFQRIKNMLLYKCGPGGSRDCTYNLTGHGIHQVVILIATAKGVCLPGM